MMQQQFEDRQMLAARVVAFTEELGRWSNQRYEITAAHPVVRVRDIHTGQLVAYSSTKADYQDSLEEFAWDFFASQGDS